MNDIYIYYSATYAENLSTMYKHIHEFYCIYLTDPFNYVYFSLSS
jgi:hypothetical protein